MKNTKKFSFFLALTLLSPLQARDAESCVINKTGDLTISAPSLQAKQEHKNKEVLSSKTSEESNKKESNEIKKEVKLNDSSKEKTLQDSGLYDLSTCQAKTLPNSSTNETIKEKENKTMKSFSKISTKNIPDNAGNNVKVKRIQSVFGDDEVTPTSPTTHEITIRYPDGNKIKQFKKYMLDQNKNEMLEVDEGITITPKDGEKIYYGDIISCNENKLTEKDDRIIAALNGSVQSLKDLRQKFDDVVQPLGGLTHIWDDFDATMNQSVEDFEKILRGGLNKNNFIFIEDPFWGLNVISFEDDCLECKKIFDEINRTLVKKNEDSDVKDTNTSK